MMTVLKKLDERMVVRVVLGSRVEKARLALIISSDPSHPLLVQKLALLAAISAAFQALALTLRSKIMKYRHKIDVGL